MELTAELYKSGFGSPDAVKAHFVEKNLGDALLLASIATAPVTIYSGGTSAAALGGLARTAAPVVTRTVVGGARQGLIPYLSSQGVTVGRVGAGAWRGVTGGTLKTAGRRAGGLGLEGGLEIGGDATLQYGVDLATGQPLNVLGTLGQSAVTGGLETFIQRVMPGRTPGSRAGRYGKEIGGFHDSQRGFGRRVWIYVGRGIFRTGFGDGRSVRRLIGGGLLSDSAKGGIRPAFDRGPRAS